MASLSSIARKRLLGTGSVVAKIAITILILFNAAFLAPGVYYGITLGHYLPIAISVGMSVVFWLIVRALAKLVSARLHRRFGDRAQHIRR